MFDPIKASQKIKEEFVDYLTTDFRFDNSFFQKKYKEELHKQISMGPYLEINDVFKTSKSMNDLIDEGVLTPLFRDLEKNKNPAYKKILPLDRPLYEHQVEAITQIVNGNNVVVSTGTGSGKTNCFLIPVIDELLKEKANGTLGSGIRAIFIFPMNALANDQIKNIRRLLMNYPDITFGIYNGGTKEEEEDAENLYEATFFNDDYDELKKPLPNEFISREKMKDTPPNILFTNYAMLEHLLLRPNDNVLFSASDFKFVVLDEAHIYTGATGIETSMLLRRLKARIKTTTKTQFILTSATLGGTRQDIIDFAEKISGEEFRDDNIITGQREIQTFDPSLAEYNWQLYKDLADESKNVKDVLKGYSIEFDNDKDESELLYDLLMSSTLYYRLRHDENDNHTAGGVYNLDDIKDRLEVDDDTLVAFISLCARAKKNGKSLIDARYHFFIRTLEGCYITLSSASEGEQELSMTTRDHTEDGKRMFEVALCDDCGSIAIVGKTEGHFLNNTKKFDEKAEYYFLANQMNSDFEDDDEEEEQKETSPLEEYYLCPSCGAIYEKGREKESRCKCKNKEYIHLIKAHITDSGDVKCCKCHTGTHRRLYIGNDGATSALATSLFESLPETTYTENSEASESNYLSYLQPIVKTSSKKEVSHYGQFLAFSDSRQEAARFAVYLSQSYSEFLRRRGICHLIQKYEDQNDYEPKNISYYVRELRNYFNSKNCFDDPSGLTETHNISNTQAWVAMLDQLARSNKDNSLTALGFMQFRYRGNYCEAMDEYASQIASHHNVSKEGVIELFDLLFFEIVRAGAILTDSPEDLGPDDMEYIFYSKKQRYMRGYKDSKKTYDSHWFPTQKAGTTRYRITKKMYYVKKVLGLSDSEEDEKEAFGILKFYFDYLTTNNFGNPYLMKDLNGDGSFAMPAAYIDVLVGKSSEAKWYRCPNCGKIETASLNGDCIIPRCAHHLEKIRDVNSLSEENHFAKLYKVERMAPLVAREHTAQLDKKEELQYQEDFIKKKINVLSCSTTFEMGVDIGDLEAVFLRNIPPTPSNYNQRAGRAGRSADAAAYVLCFAKLNSHDMHFFSEPEDMIKGTILPPYFKLENEKIARRHIYAVTLSLFFQEHPSFYDKNNAQVFLNWQGEEGLKGYEMFYSWLEAKRRNNDDLLRERLLASIPGNDEFIESLGLKDYSWVDDFIGENGALRALIDDYNDNIKKFEDMINELQNIKPTGNDSIDQKNENKLANANRNLRRYKQNQLIDFLARGNILPKYGFPVDTVELEQNISSSTYSDLNLDRDLQIAIGEYAPSSEVIANGRLYTSRYIKKSVTDLNYTWKKSTLAKCPHCGEMNFSEVPLENSDHVVCASCGKLISGVYFKKSILPEAGFITEKDSKPVPMKRQEQNYTVPISYIGNGKTIEKISVTMNKRKISLESTEDDSLLVYSRSQFYVCEKCGYSVSCNDESPFPGDSNANKKARGGHHITANKPHKNSYGEECSCKDFDCYYLHHTFKTDVAKITFEDASGADDKKTMLSVLWAIYGAMLNVLQIDHNDLRCCLSYSQNKEDKLATYSLIIFDSIAGGSGYCRKLCENNGEVFKTVLYTAFHNMVKCDCDPSCYKCLRCYENRNEHDDLDRHKVISFLQPYVVE